MELLTNTTMGQRIRAYRQSAGMTQKELAEKCGITESAIRNYELGNRIPDWDTLSLIAEQLRVSYYAIADEDVSAVFGAAHTLFLMEKLYGIHPEQIDGKIHLVFDNDVTEEDLKKQPLKLYGGPGVMLEQALRNWARVYEKFAAEKIDWETYLRWQSKFPVFQGDLNQDEVGNAQLDEAAQMEQPMKNHERARKPKKLNAR